MSNKPRPKIVCLCGSTRFYEVFQRANYEETMKGHIVLSVGFFYHRSDMHDKHIECTPEQKVALDELHKRKIDLADEILVLNVGGYIGASTKSEIDYAFKNGKTVRWWQEWDAVLTATDTQHDYLTDLFSYFKFSPLERKAFLRDLFNRDIYYIDELTVDEATIAISRLEERRKNMSITATVAQQEYLTDLFLECNFTRNERKAFLQDLFNREIKFLDELTVNEASKAIYQLKQQKEDKQQRYWEKKKADSDA